MEFGWKLVRKDRATRICIFVVEVRPRKLSYVGVKKKVF